MLETSFLAHTHIQKSYSCTYTHTHTWCYARDIFYCTYTHTSCYARDIFSCTLTHTHTSFYARDIFSCTYTHTSCTYFLGRYIYIYIHIFSCTYPRTWCYARDSFSCTHIHSSCTYTRMKKVVLMCFEEALSCKTQWNVTMGLRNPRDFQGAIITWNDYGAVAPSTFDSQT